MPLRKGWRVIGCASLHCNNLRGLRIATRKSGILWKEFDNSISSPVLVSDFTRSSQTWRIVFMPTVS